MKAGDLACHLTRNFAPALLLRRGEKLYYRGDEYGEDLWDTWVVSLDGKEVEVHGVNLIPWKDREREGVPV